MATIIKGMLSHSLPWGLVLIGMAISGVMELCGISSLAFAVGVYLPISSSAPLFIGGMVRWLVDRRMRKKLKEHKLNEEQLTAESDKSPMTQTQNQPRTNFEGALLDLDESDFSATSLADDVVLDLDFEEPVPGHVEAAALQQTKNEAASRAASR